MLSSVLGVISALCSCGNEWKSTEADPELREHDRKPAVLVTLADAKVDHNMSSEAKKILYGRTLKVRTWKGWKTIGQHNLVIKQS